MVQVAQVVSRREDRIAVCEIRGEVDTSNVDDVLDVLLGEVGAETPGLVVDLAATSYLDSTGVRMLFELARRLRARSQELRLAVPDDGIIRRVLLLVALPETIPLHRLADDAVAELQRRR